MQIQQITSKENAKLKAAAKLVHAKKERVATGSFLAEGCRLCTDALNSGRRPLRVFVTEQLLEREDCQKLLAASPENYLITEQLAHKLSDTQTPQGVFCVFPILDNCAQLDTIKKNRIVILSSLQDPGNIGTIIRTAEAFGVDMILMSADCPDLYAPKTLRATMGGVFRLPVVVWRICAGRFSPCAIRGCRFMRRRCIGTVFRLPRLISTSPVRWSSATRATD